MSSPPLVRSLAGQIVNRLRSEILSGKLRPGEPLREVHLAKRFDVSRGPVREALVELTKEGFLVAQPRGGVRVAPPASDEIQELVMPIRRTIETFALRRAFPLLGEKEFQAWDETLERMRLACERKDIAGIAEQDLALHRTILELAGQPDLLLIWTTIMSRMHGYFSVAIQSYKKLTEIHTMHVALIGAFRKGNVEAAVRALEDHIW